MANKVRQEIGETAGTITVPGVSAECRRIVQVILAGGSGTRLWPVSREQFPKQLIGVIGTESLLQATVLRMKHFPAAWDVAAEPVIVCGEEHRFATGEQVRESGVTARIVVEPARRDTAPALTLAALTACADGQDAILVAMPADHAIADLDALHASIETAARFAQAGDIATLGIPPTRPDTGFGYIRLGDALEDGAHRIDRFVEKPAAELATQYVAAGNYWWNSGIFVVRASVWLAAGSQLQPEMYMQGRAAYGACEAGKAGGDTFRLKRAAFGRCRPCRATCTGRPRCVTSLPDPHKAYCPGLA